MKNSEILEINKILSEVKLTKLNRELRSIVLKNHTATFKLANDITEVIEEAKKRLLDGLEYELYLLGEYRSEYKNASEDRRVELTKLTNDNCRNILIAEKELNEFYIDYLDRDVDLDLIKMDKEEFVDMCSDSGVEITPSDLIKLDFLFV